MSASPSLRQSLRDATPYLALALLALIVLTTSPLSPWSTAVQTADSSDFFYEGARVLAGAAPYVDFFDHKGPAIFLINAAGQVVLGELGVWLVELISLSLAASICYRTMRVLFGTRASFLGTATVLVFVVSCLEHGNFTEEYALPLEMAALAVLVRFAAVDRLGRVGAVTMGVTCAAAFLLKLTTVPLWAAYCLGVAVFLMARRRTREAAAAAVWFLTGALAVLVPVFGWLAARGALGACFDQMIAFNREYAGIMGPGESVGMLVKYFARPDTLAAVSVLVSGGMALWAWRRQTRGIRGGGGGSARTRAVVLPSGRFLGADRVLLLSLSNLAALILLLVAAAMPGRAYGHYLLVLAPCHALVCGFLWRATVVFIARRRPAARTVLAIGLAVCVLAAGSLYVAFRLAHKSQFGFSSSGPEAGFQAEMADAIRSNTPNEEPIQVYGNASWIYLASDRLAATKYHYIPLKGEPPALRGEVLGLIEDARPRVIIDVDDRLKATGFDLLQYSLVYQQVDNGLPMTYRVYALPQEIPSQG